MRNPSLAIVLGKTVRNIIGSAKSSPIRRSSSVLRGLFAAAAPPHPSWYWRYVTLPLEPQSSYSSLLQAVHRHQLISLWDSSLFIGFGLQSGERLGVYHQTPGSLRLVILSPLQDWEPCDGRSRVSSLKAGHSPAREPNELPPLSERLPDWCPVHSLVYWKRREAQHPQQSEERLARTGPERMPGRLNSPDLWLGRGAGSSP
jgi:hypothetical protein